MTIKLLLHCTLIFMTLVTSGCGFLSDESTSTAGTSSSPTPQQENKIQFAAAASDVQRAVKQLSSSDGPGQAPTVKAVKDCIDDAIQKLGGDEKRLRELCTDCSLDSVNEAVEVLQTLTAISKTLAKDSQKKSADLEVASKRQLEQDLGERVVKLNKLSSANAKTTEPPLARPSFTPRNEPNEETGYIEWWTILTWSVEIIGGLVILALLLSAVNYLWKRSWRTLESNVGQIVKTHVTVPREAQTEYAAKLSSLSSSQAEMNIKLSELDADVRSLAGLLRESLTKRPDRNPSFGESNYQLNGVDVSLIDEPEFPVSAFDYLGKMDRFANVVRPDFQNGILVNDPDGNGELVLIQDPGLRDDTRPLFVIPRATQFHTKQDFYTYYQKYYDCVKPSAGDVWIIGPAVVEKVTGGWQLREKGMLEIR